MSAVNPFNADDDNDITQDGPMPATGPHLRDTYLAEPIPLLHSMQD